MNSYHYHVGPRVLRAIREGRWDSEFKTSGTSRSFLEEVTRCWALQTNQGALFMGPGEAYLLKDQCAYASSSPSAPPTSGDRHAGSQRLNESPYQTGMVVKGP